MFWGEVLSFWVKWEARFLHLTSEDIAEKVDIVLVSCGNYSDCGCVDLGRLPHLFIAQFSCEECLTHWLAYGQKAIAGSCGYE